jgi:type II secretory ATPase GspE/PulE/Tfp pilus assembly ATPase PilB-like protein
MVEQDTITDVTKILDIKLTDNTAIVSYIKRHEDLHALVTESGDIYYVKDKKRPRMINQLVRMVIKATGWSPKIIEITESVYQSFIGSTQTTKSQTWTPVTPNMGVEELLVSAIKQGVSDIHLHVWQETFVEGTGSADNGQKNAASSWIRFRKHQILISAARISYEGAYNIYRAAFTGELYGSTNIDDRKSNDASFQYQYKGMRFLVRLASLPEARGTSMTFRIRNAHDRIELVDCGYSHKQLDIINQFTKRNAGLLVIGGPTNSGKSTALTAILAEMADRAILSYEDPVEVLLPHVSHIQMRRDGPNAENAIRELMLQTMRMDPDVINAGELRDELMMSFSKEKATEGKLTTGTIHCGRVIMCLNRLLQLGMSIEEMAAPDALLGIVAQKLIPVICKNCALTEHPKSEVNSYYQQHLGDNIHYHNKQGCQSCDNTGISGQMVVSETLAINSTIRALIMQKNWAGIVDYFWDQEIDTLHVDALMKIHQGKLDPQMVEQSIDQFDSDNLRHHWRSKKPLMANKLLGSG